MPEPQEPQELPAGPATHLALSLQRRRTQRRHAPHRPRLQLLCQSEGALPLARPLAHLNGIHRAGAGQQQLLSTVRVACGSGAREQTVQ